MLCDAFESRYNRLPLKDEVLHFRECFHPRNHYRRAVSCEIPSSIHIDVYFISSTLGFSLIGMISPRLVHKVEIPRAAAPSCSLDLPFTYLTTGREGAGKLTSSGMPLLSPFTTNDVARLKRRPHQSKRTMHQHQECARELARTPYSVAIMHQHAPNIKTVGTCSVSADDLRSYLRALVLSIARGIPILKASVSAEVSPSPECFGVGPSSATNLSVVTTI